MEQFGQIIAKTLQRLQFVWSGFDSFRFGLKHRATFPLYQNTHDFTHAPTGSTQNLKSIDIGHEQRDAIVANHADTLRKTIEGLKFKSG